jgi:hypothetical protein
MIDLSGAPTDQLLLLRRHAILALARGGQDAQSVLWSPPETRADRCLRRLYDLLTTEWLMRTSYGDADLENARNRDWWESKRRVKS